MKSDSLLITLWIDCLIRGWDAFEMCAPVAVGGEAVPPVRPSLQSGALVDLLFCGGVVMFPLQPCSCDKATFPSDLNTLVLSILGVHPQPRYTG